jgi:hypothetical protein
MLPQLRLDKTQIGIMKGWIRDGRQKAPTYMHTMAHGSLMKSKISAPSGIARQRLMLRAEPDKAGGQALSLMIRFACNKCKQFGNI